CECDRFSRFGKNSKGDNSAEFTKNLLRLLFYHHYFLTTTQNRSKSAGLLFFGSDVNLTSNVVAVCCLNPKSSRSPQRPPRGQGCFILAKSSTAKTYHGAIFGLALPIDSSQLGKDS
ncbi:hypothetical protein, partial [Microcoleus sp. BROC3]|uniref:hypothetical protein n=1 Tax=Microcoleus sp. BROC3 TaxID=3055323 RepID=UPI002FD000CD